MTNAVEGAFLAVARFRKPHGLKGEAVVWVLTDQPEEVLVAGRVLTPVDDAGRPTGPPLTVERSRPYHRQWLVKFAEIDHRAELEQWEQRLFGVPRDDLEAPGENEAYLHELPGMEVWADGRVVGVVREVIEIPAGQLLSVDVDGREVLVPLRKPIVVQLERGARRITIEPPAGLLEL